MFGSHLLASRHFLAVITAIYRLLELVVAAAAARSDLVAGLQQCNGKGQRDADNQIKTRERKVAGNDKTEKAVCSEVE